MFELYAKHSQITSVLSMRCLFNSGCTASIMLELEGKFIFTTDRLCYYRIHLVHPTLNIHFLRKGHRYFSSFNHPGEDFTSFSGNFCVFRRSSLIIRHAYLFFVAFYLDSAFNFHYTVRHVLRFSSCC